MKEVEFINVEVSTASCKSIWKLPEEDSNTVGGIRTVWLGGKVWLSGNVS